MADEDIYICPHCNRGEHASCDVPRCECVNDRHTPNQVTELREVSGLTRTQIARLIGVADRKVASWEWGTAMPEKHADRVRSLHTRIVPLADTPDMRRRALLDSSSGPSPFRLMLRELPESQVIQVRALTALQQLGL